MAVEQIAAEPTGRRLYAGPLYVQLTHRLRDRIRAGDWSPGMLLPSEADLAREYGVSVGTARKALEGLEIGGWITRKQGRGTFVTDLANQQNQRLSRFRSLSTGQDSFVGAIATVIAQDVDRPTADEAAALNLDLDEKVVRINRICRRDAKFRVLERLIAPLEVFPGLDVTKRLPLNLFSLLINEFGVIPQRSRDRVTARTAHDDVAKHLDLPEGNPVLAVESLIWDIDNRPIAMLERWAKLQEAAYEVTLS